MTYKEEVRDLFTVPQGYHLAHCISADYALGAGIAVQFDKAYNMKAKLNEFFSEDNVVGTALLVDNVFNLVTKQYGRGKPTYDALEDALYSMAEYANDLLVTKIAMPKIGCGLDGLDWEKVSEMIQEIFDNTDIEILVCLKEDQTRAI